MFIEKAVAGLAVITTLVGGAWMLDDRHASSDDFQKNKKFVDWTIEEMRYDRATDRLLDYETRQQYRPSEYQKTEIARLHAEIKKLEIRMSQGH